MSDMALSLRLSCCIRVNPPRALMSSIVVRPQQDQIIETGEADVLYMAVIDAQVRQSSEVGQWADVKWH